MLIAAFVPSTLDYLTVGRPAENLEAGRGLSASRAALYESLVRISTLFAAIVILAQLSPSYHPRARYWGLVILPFAGTAISSHYRDHSPVLAGIAAPTVALSLWLAGGRLSSSDVLWVVRKVLTLIILASLALGVLIPSAACYSPRRLDLTMGILPGNCSAARLAGIANHPNTLGAIAATALVLIVATDQRVQRRLFSAVPPVAALILSESRGAGAAAIAAILVVIAMGNPGTVRLRRRVFIAALGVSAAIFALFKGADPGGGDYNGRQIVWDYVAAHWREQPLIGHGVQSLANLAAQPNSPLPAYAGQAHNQFYQSLYTTGLIGLSLLILFAVALFVVALRHRADAPRITIGLATLFIVRGLFESPFDTSYLNSNAFLLAICIPLMCRVRQTKVEFDDHLDRDDDLQPTRDDNPMPLAPEQGIRPRRLT